jgi:hypothetical protein
MSFVERSGKNSWRARYWRDDGTHGSLSGFPTRKAAELKARDIDMDRRRGEFLDPDAGNLTLNAWADHHEPAPEARWVKVLTMMLADAADDHLIAAATRV